MIGGTKKSEEEGKKTRSIPISAKVIRIYHTISVHSQIRFTWVRSIEEKLKQNSKIEKRSGLSNSTRLLSEKCKDK